MVKERNLSTVINVMLSIIPEADNDAFEYLTKPLTDVLNIIEFTAPEAMSLRWEQVSNIVKDYFEVAYDEDIPWHHRFIDCWTNKR